MPKFVLLLCLVLLTACASNPTPPAAVPAAQSQDSTRFEPDIVAFEQADSVVRRRPGGVVFVGSSSIRLWSSLGDDFPGAAPINRGFGGSRLRDTTFYAQRIVIPYQPRAVVVYAGDNDLAEGRTPQQVRDDFAALVSNLRAQLPQARIAFISIKPSPAREALMGRMREANALVRDYARGQQGVDFLDVATPMLDADGQPRSELFLDDHLHMNQNGYAIWTDVVGKWLDRL
ncbi:GDSL-type esterase/lipase family protein [Lysobacter sp. S4-A87]|uniref:SGNH/GDSL hydrolase family protein n=1 Tax=Lysobacter sp. S4-A87 TaxID=2925843 RepID=UPI001F52FFC6|nr:SGNH/GDSL hydrolase family protein [Lysobacter sp. S4-A87]UNK50165.1 GDSL-type esterase/lipase family protein [Lysobacter sp. S4-A87]